MISKDTYRKFLLDSYFEMLSIHSVYRSLAMDICVLGELKDLEEYIEEDMLLEDIFMLIEDAAVRRINQFLIETKIFTDEMREANNILSEELEVYNYPATPSYEGEPNRTHTIALLLVYTKGKLPGLPVLINELCNINEEPPITDYNDTSGCDDENVKLIVAFYNKVLELADALMETEIRGKE